MKDLIKGGFHGLWKKRAATALLIGALCLVWAAPAAATNVKTPWQFTFAPCAWLTDSSSDLTWSAQGLLGCRFGEVLQLWGGYRALGVDCKEGRGVERFELDATLYGPVAGIGFEF